MHENTDTPEDDGPRVATIPVEMPDGQAVCVEIHPPGIVHLARFARVAARIGRAIAAATADRDTLDIPELIDALADHIDETLLDLVFATCRCDPAADLRALDMGQGMLVVQRWLEVTLRPKSIRPLATALERMLEALQGGGQEPTASSPAQSDPV